MTHEELLQFIAEVQHHQSELDDVEVKSARGGTPQRLFAPLSAFANRTGGGVMLFGLDENRNFEIVGVGNVHKLQEEISHLASSEMEPALRPEFTVEDVEGKMVVAVEVFELPAEQKPCFYKPAGLQKGSYIRRLNHVDSVTANRELRGLVQLGLIEQQSTRRWAYYTLNVPAEVNSDR